ncbi:MAG: c-type cytochrome [Planctomycetota bacterium]
MNVGLRKVMMAGLVAAFATQTTLVYADPTAEAQAPLDEVALHGRQLWHEHNCQVCHQLHGFGGFLGPDLTNAASRLSEARVAEVLTDGAGQMPAFGMAPDDIRAIHAFLRGMDGTGVGQARYAALPEPSEVRAAVDAHAAARQPSASVGEGRDLYRAFCATCHCLFRPQPLGPFCAPDLSDVGERLSDAELEQVIAEGRPAKGMVPPPLQPAQRAAVIEFLQWVGAEREAIRERLGADDAASGTPWWEYR